MNLANYKIKKPKIEVLIQNLLFFLFLFCFALSSVGYASPSRLCDFETGENTNGPEGGGVGYFRGRTYDPLLVSTPGAVGTNYCVVYNSAPDQEKPQSFYLDNPDSRTLIEEAYGANRVRAWIKLPEGYMQGSDRNFHFGTYTRDPEIPSGSQGDHFYHYYNIPASLYWTKIIANEHPCHWSGHSEKILDNPTITLGWNYYEGFTRFYFHCKEYGSKPDGYWDWYIDEVEFYHEDEPENTVSINAVSCSYFGEGHFQVNWHGEFRTSNDHHYEVRYSTSPITNANYAQATLAPGCSDLIKVPGSYAWVKADFTIPVENGQTYYFAIKDLSSDNPYVTRIDYPVPGESGGDVEPPDDVANFTPTPGPNQIFLSWTNPTDIDFAGVMIRYRTDGTYPSNITEGTAVPNGNDGRIPGAPSTSGSYLHTGLEDGTTYYYSAFSYDNSGNYSYTAHTFATPQAGGNHVPVISDFTVTPSTVPIGDPVTFDVVATDEDGDDLTYTIDFGDGTPSGSGNQVVHTYGAAGIFTAIASVKDPGGLEAISSLGITVTVNDRSLPNGTITLQNGQNGYMGNDMRLLFSRDPNVNYDATWAGRVGEYAGVNRVVLRFDDLISQIPSNASIVSAHLNLHQYQNRGTTGYVLELFALNRSYSSDTVCWNSPWQIPGATGADDFESTELSSVTLDNQVDVWREWDVTSYVRQVISGRRKNLGFFIRSQNEENGYCRFKMDNDPDSSLRPKLVVTYTTDSGVNVSPIINSFTGTPASLNNPGETTTFNVSATDPDGDSLTYTVNFGDGTANGSGSQVVHTYETKGTYTAEVTVDDGNGNTVAKSLQITVDDVPPAKPTGVTAK